ncbi:MAG: 3-hydroxyisobutyrate dehydrogenase [Mycobacterium sp.]|nr:3-hydroxyisobutyrate dehydrogenase [Mycobacterium sp.]
MTKPPLVVAVLGTGTMGAPMARNLTGVGYDVRVWNRTAAKAQALVADGAHWAADPADAAAGCDVLITMLSDGAAVEQVLTGRGGAFSTLPDGSIWIQMSTVGIEWSDRLAALASWRGITFVDAPVSGSSVAAEHGDLIILASGAASVRSQVGPIFDVLGGETVWLDHPGDGSRLKVALNNWLAVLVEGMAETIALAETLGLNPRLFLNTVSDGPMASQYAIDKGEAMLNSEFTPGFPLRHATKDAELAVSAAHSHGMQLALTKALLPRWYAAIADGHGADDVAAAITAAAPSASRRKVGAA